MSRDGLIVMIPVDHEMALKKRWGKMPLPDLVTRLRERADGRVLRIDDTATTAEELEDARPATTSLEQWKDFTKRISVSELYFEVTI